MRGAAEKVAEFRRLHRAGCFLMPNPWDLGSARALAGMGFPALATTSSGLAWANGRADGQVPFEAVLAHLEAMAGAVDVPLNADLEDGYAVLPEDVAANVLRAVRTGVAGLSVEDSSRGDGDPLLDRDLAADRVAAAREAIDRSGTGVVLTARSEGFVTGRPDLGETVRRLQAYADAGADCLYAPGITTVAQITTVVGAVAPRPVNLLVNAPFITVDEAAGLGVRCISVGGALARAAWGGWLGVAREIREDGTFGGLGGLPDVDALHRHSTAVEERR